ncbi:pyrroline-5-carboxylate reductase [Halalkalibacter wakoensis JCM 9140]|uniref:Pyrroline-5-carboxylate reductase n=1 Tax=Halalkalibacter wakoensis JCM 9140 TaxID=1236970 RepID=W4Q6Z2_9BACI|nr:pyrroline-5-carboxylate reductase [Halalkalibacter wakoensis]GAE27831.1 pyrroline-5-carboxylate reductase [Halalkalibacter wakoensis JCM 9140]
MIKQKVAFLGAGSMAEAIISGLLSNKKLTPEQIYVTNRQNKARLSELKELYGVHVNTNHEQIVKSADIIILAMKPAGVKEAVASIRSFTSENQLFISVLAGITTEYLSYLLGHNAPIIRTMPNTSASVGSSATVISPGAYVHDAQLQIAASMFESIGIVKHVKETDLDSLTAIVGSGPAYMYYLFEAMTNTLKELELDEQLGEELLLEMMQGSINLLKATSDSPRTLYESVRSPGGTTEAGLQVLANDDVQRTISTCILRAAARSKEITKEKINNT